MNTDLFTDTFLEKLRNTTALSHKNLEALPISLSIMNPAITTAQYALYLSLMHDVVKDVETTIYPLLKDVVTDIEERLKTHLIENDLRYLGEPKTQYSTSISTHAHTFSTAFALGIMYVVEGSSLGGRVILKNISAALGYDGDNGAQYFSGYGNTTGSHWKNFLAMLSRYAESSNCEEEIIAGADFAFTAITQHFTDNTPD